MASLTLVSKKLNCLNKLCSLNRSLPGFPNFRLCGRDKAQTLKVNRLQRNCTLSQCTNRGSLFTHNPMVYHLKSFHPRLPVRNLTNQRMCRKFKPVIYGRYFHTSEPRTAAPILPVIGAALARFSGPIAKLMKLLAVVAGRSFRKWWTKLPDDRKKKLKEMLFSRTEVIALIFASLGGGWLLLYYIHLEETPYTKRPRYVGVTPNQIRDIAETQWRELLEVYADNIVSVSHPDHKRTFRVVEKLVKANYDETMENIKWELNVISSDEINAFVLPNGQIFVFSGLLRFLDANDDALAIILGHEIAHAVLQHSAEQLCFHGFINLIKVVLLATIWALLPNDLLAFLTQFIQNAILKLFWNLPYSRALEEEADRVGLYFAAKACFDVRQGPKVWYAFGALEKMQEIPNVEWLSTHPSHENREKNLEEIVPEALALRKLCKCPELSGAPTVHDKVKPLRLVSAIYNAT